MKRAAANPNRRYIQRSRYKVGEFNSKHTNKLFALLLLKK